MCLGSNLSNGQSKDPDKVERYLGLLDSARCNGSWQEIPELARKVEKHAPQRNCLALTARSESQIASALVRHPSTSSSTIPSGNLQQLIPPLLAAAETEQSFPEDAFQARTCLAWLHWVMGEPGLALSRIPKGIDDMGEHLAKEGQKLNGSTSVCVVKGACIQGASQEMVGNIRAAIKTYISMLPQVLRTQSTAGISPEYRFWAQNLLGRYCMLVGTHVASNASNSEKLLSPRTTVAPSSILTPFRAWARFANGQPSYEGRLGPLHESPSAGRRVWQAYYNTLSIILQLICRDTVRSGDYMVSFRYSSKASGNEELKSVETVYERLLLNEISFPEAKEANPEVEAWTDQVMVNWSLLTAPDSLDEDLEKGGKPAASRRVQGILYRAATRTFHSTRILRHLFTVHTALAEFCLARKALDTYIDIVTKGKARVEKSGEVELGLDNDSTVLLTVSAGITMLCTYGRREEAEKAQGLVEITSQWLQEHNKHIVHQPVTSANDVPQDLVDRPQQATSLVSRISLAAAFRAIGISQANWSGLTYEPSERAILQGQAIASLQRATEINADDSQGIRILYNLTMAYADSRDVDAGVLTVKQALMGSSADDDTSSAEDFSEDDQELSARREPLDRRLLLRCWHLLGLLLTAKQNFAAAVDSCIAALEVYGGDSALLGDDQHGFTRLGFYEKRDILEVKMTQLTLTEVIESPEEAVNGSSELLRLYSTLFKYTQSSTPSTLTVESASPPESANGAPRSFRSSVFGRSRNSVNRKSQLPPRSSRFGSDTSQPSPSDDLTMPAIQISPDGSHDGPAEPTLLHPRNLGQAEPKKLQKRDSRKSMASARKNRASSPSRLSTARSTDPYNKSATPHSRPTTASEQTRPSVDSDPDSNEVGLAVSHDGPSRRDVPPTGFNGPSGALSSLSPTSKSQPQHLPSSFPKPPPEQNNASRPGLYKPVFPPLEPFFPPTELSRHSLTLLVKIWLLISALYRRASMPSDAASAVSEATTHVRTIETLVAQTQGSSNASFTTPGYGRAKAVAELWADVFSEQAMQALAKSEKQDAEAKFEEALLWWPDHVAAIVGLCNLLLDAYEAPIISSKPPAFERKSPITPILLPSLESPPPTPPPSAQSPTKDTKDTALLHRLAARDRAYGLLITLTESGCGWDSSEAWMALARAYELIGQVEKAKEALWWVVELEEGRGIRPWNVVGGW